MKVFLVKNQRDHVLGVFLYWENANAFIGDEANEFCIEERETNDKLRRGRKKKNVAKSYNVGATYKCMEADANEKIMVGHTYHGKEVDNMLVFDSGETYPLGRFIKVSK